MIERVPSHGAGTHPTVRMLLEGEASGGELEGLVGELFPFAPTLEGLAACARARGSPKEAPASELVGDRWVVVTGQQAGLFGGPLMVLWKALTAVAIARQAEAHLGEPVVPVFWAATEDHDLDEIRSIRLIDRAGRLRKRSVHFAGETVDTPAQAAMLDDRVVTFIDWMAQALGASPADVAPLRSLYAPGRTAGDAFCELLRTWLEPLGMIVLEPRDVARRSAQVLEWEAARPAAGRLATEAGERLQELGLPAPLTPGSETQVYGIHDGRRVRGLSTAPQLSAAAALRPIWQDHALPVLATVCGPTEVAYHAQLTAGHRYFGSCMPVVWPRASGTLLDEETRRLLELRGVPAAEALDTDLLAPPSELPPPIADRLQALRATLARELGGVIEELPSDYAARPARKVLRSFDRDLAKLDRRLRNRLAAERGIGQAERESLAARILPEGVLQERKLAALPFALRPERDLTTRMLDAIDPLDHRHVLLSL